MTRAKLFRNGGSQAVRLPKDCRFEGDEVEIRRDGRRVVLEPVDEWSEAFLAVLGAWSEPIERPRSERLQSARDPLRRP
jgi:antitoxin VapB